jgi:integrase
MGKNAMPGGLFCCADCTLFSASIPETAATEVKEAAHMLVWLQSQRVRDSSQNTYASGLHRFTKWATTKAGLDMNDILPPTKHGVVRTDLVKLFMAWACTRYKVSTIESTLSAIKDWHKSKGLNYDHLCTDSIKDLINSIKVQQGPEGLPVGKVGLSRPLLRLLIGYLRNKEKAADPQLAKLYLRDLTWLLLGYFGMMRRSELIALQMQDLSIGTINGQGYIEVTIRRSKTDRRGEGAQVTITGVTKDSIHIAPIIQSWLNYRTGSGAKDTDPIFPKWDLDSRTLSNNAILSGQALAERLKLYLRDLVGTYPDLSVNPNAYGMHSLRRGGGYGCMGRWVPVEKIKAHGRWRSDAVRAYMQTSRSMRLQVTQGM